MANIFISYNQEDYDDVIHIHQLLEKSGHSVWRDQESMYGGAAWPKALGEAIRTNDFYLLCWSQRAQESYFVELEWTVAIALKKPIIPYLIDDTPLPATLKPFQGVSSIEALIAALGKITPPRHEVYEDQIIEKLKEVNANDPAKVVEMANQILFQQNRTVKRPRKRVYQVALIGAIVMIITSIVLYWFRPHEELEPPGQNEQPGEINLTGSGGGNPPAPELEEFVEVTLVLPAYMRDASVTVDGEEPTNLKHTENLRIFKVLSKDGNYKIAVEKEGEYPCFQEIAIHQDTSLTPCF